MIISQNVIDRITDLLKMSGISSPEILEEMADHYLADIESRVKAGEDLQNTIRSTYQTIANTDLTALDNNKKTNNWKIGLLFMVVILSFAFYLMKPNSNPSNPKEINEAQVSIMPDGWPIQTDNRDVSSYFGIQMHPIQKVNRFHKGIDIKGSIGTPIISTGDGVVIEIVTKNSLSGKYIIIKHNDHYSTKYAHLDKVIVKINQIVKKGDIIGEMGNTGMSTAPHLHYEIRHNQNAVDPINIAS